MKIRNAMIVAAGALIVTAAPGFAQAADETGATAGEGNMQLAQYRGRGGSRNYGGRSHGHHHHGHRGRSSFGIGLGLGVLGAAVAAPYIAAPYYGYPAYAPAYPAPVYPPPAYGGYNPYYPAPGIYYDPGYFLGPLPAVPSGY